VSLQVVWRLRCGLNGRITKHWKSSGQRMNCDSYTLQMAVVCRLTEFEGSAAVTWRSETLWETTRDFIAVHWLMRHMCLLRPCCTSVVSARLVIWYTSKTRQSQWIKSGAWNMKGTAYNFWRCTLAESPSSKFWVDWWKIGVEFWGLQAKVADVKFLEIVVIWLRSFGC